MSDYSGTFTEQTTENGSSQNGDQRDFTGARAMGGSYRDPRLEHLYPKHQDQLIKGSGNSVDTILKRGVVSVGTPLELLQYGVQPAVTPGMLFPWFHPGWVEGEPPIPVYRPDEPADPKKKYIWPTGVPVRLGVLPEFQGQLQDTDIPLWLVEGLKKSDCLTSRGKLSVTLNGTYCFGGKPEEGLAILKDWEKIALSGRLVIICFDSDAQRNSQVMKAREKLTQFLKSRGAIVKWVILPDAFDGSKQGIDDWFAAGGTLEELDSLITEPFGSQLVTAPLTDVGNAERFAYENQGRVVWVEGLGWFVWDGKRWRRGGDRLADRLAMNTLKATHHAAIDLSDTQQSKDLKEHAKKSEQLPRIAAMLSLARSLLQAEIDEFDADPFTLNCLNGTLNLRTRKLRPHDPEDRITKLCPVIYNPEATCPTWEAFLTRAMQGDQEMLSYLPQLVGIFLTGDVSEKFLPIIWGPGDTGKTTFSETLFELLGSDYSQPMKEATIALSSKIASGGEATPDLARLPGVRLVVVSETSQRMQLNTARIKAMTGRNRITARELHKSPFDFTPTHKILIETNNKPGMRDGDEATFNRVHLIPFNVVIPKPEQDGTLPLKFKEELPGILAWAVQGCLEWQKNGSLKRPAAVDQATASYREESDPLKEFFEDRCIFGEGKRVLISGLYKDYLAWSKENDESYPFGKQRFNAMVEVREGIVRAAREWRGVGLQKDSESGKEKSAYERKTEDEG